MFTFTANLSLLVVALLLWFVVVIAVFGRPDRAARASAVLRLLCEMVSALLGRGGPS